MKQTSLLIFTCALMALAQKSDHPTGSRITPPTIRDVAPLGVSRGTTAEMTIEGFNLAKASSIYFSEQGITGKILRIKELPDLPDVRLGSNGTPSTIDVGPLPPRNQVTVELEIAPTTEVGVVKFRLLTPLGSSPEGQFLVEPYFGESADREANDTPENAVEAFLPSILAGSISRPGDVDHFKIQVKAGEEIVFENAAMQIGSTLQPVVAILSEDGSVVKEYGLDSPKSAQAFAHKFATAGTYYVRVADYQLSGRGSNFYRYKAGRFAVAARAYPLGMRKGEAKDVTLYGPGIGTAKIAVKGEPSPEDESAVILRPKTDAGKAVNTIKLALGDDPEVESTGRNTSVATAQAVTLPVTVNGRVEAPLNGQPLANYFRFSAKKGQTVILDVNARRLDSELDSEVEVLDAKGKSIERATIRAVAETFTTLRDHDGIRPGIRIQSWNMFAIGDYVMVGGEILKIRALPLGPDEDFQSESFGGIRITYFGTSSEAHANDKPVYKIQVHPPGAQFTANGLPLVRLQYRNDDGGPGFLKDSYLEFTAPADGDYIARIRDVRGDGGPEHAYRLSIREPRPDFRLTMNPRNPNVPQGGFIPITFTAFRMDGFTGPIDIAIEGLPPGLHATKGTIGKGQVTATLLLSADRDAKLTESVPLKPAGRASVNGKALSHLANPEDKIKLASLMPIPDVLMTAETKEVELEPGTTAQVAVSVSRQRDYGGRVPVQVLNLPPGVRVLDVGLNGVLVTEDETKRSFTIEALATAEPVEQTIYVAGLVETRSPQQSLFAAPQPIRLRVKPKSQVAGQAGSSAKQRPSATQQ
jgi:hypothetical protein